MLIVAPSGSCNNIGGGFGSTYSGGSDNDNDSDSDTNSGGDGDDDNIGNDDGSGWGDDNDGGYIGSDDNDSVDNDNDGDSNCGNRDDNKKCHGQMWEMCAFFLTKPISKYFFLVLRMGVKVFQKWFRNDSTSIFVTNLFLKLHLKPKNTTILNKYYFLKKLNHLEYYLFLKIL